MRPQKNRLDQHKTADKRRSLESQPQGNRRPEGMPYYINRLIAKKALRHLGAGVMIAPLPIPESTAPMAQKVRRRKGKLCLKSLCQPPPCAAMRQRAMQHQPCSRAMAQVAREDRVPRACFQAHRSPAR